MRLIDADKLMESLNPKESVWVGLVLSELIANAPTVNAIPIEWINDWLNKGRNAKYFIPMMEMIKEWENREWLQ